MAKLQTTAPTPKKKTSTVVPVRMTVKLRDRLKRLAKKDQRSMNGYILLLIGIALDTLPEDTPPQK